MFIKEGIVHFNIEVEDSEVREIPVFVPTSYFLENVIFSAFKTQDSIISQRHEIARQHSEDVDWYLIVFLMYPIDCRFPIILTRAKLKC